MSTLEVLTMAHLTDPEKQEIFRFIEAGKPLPDKYRFLLFEDKREVELVWNGKTNEVCNIVLPFQTIEQVDEPRAEKREDTEIQTDLFSMDFRGRQLKDVWFGDASDRRDSSGIVVDHLTSAIAPFATSAMPSAARELYRNTPEVGETVDVHSSVMGVVV